MDLTLISSAVTAYSAELGESGKKRLEFFEGLWKLEQQLMDEGGAACATLELPTSEQLKAWYWEEKPFFTMAPPVFNAERFAAVLLACSDYLADHAGLFSDAAECLRSFDWAALLAIESVDLQTAGTRPDQWLQAAADEARKMADPVSAAVLPPYHVALACALRVALEPLAQHLLKAYQVSREDYDAHVKPRQCPVCGAHAAAAYVGPTPLSEGNGRILYCAHCSATWEYERIRCGHCGSTNQGKLHYFHLEGDTAHRLHLCNECGNYLKTSFVAQSPVPFSFEVEEVVMVSLEQVAQDERFQAEGN